MITPTEKKLLSSIDCKELTSLTSDLVRIDSVIRPEKGNTEHEVVKFIEDWLKNELSIEPLVYEVSPGRENLVATIDSKVEGPCLMLAGHKNVAIVFVCGPEEGTYGCCQNSKWLRPYNFRDTEKKLLSSIVCKELTSLTSDL
ncbi:MAG TPA: hypothetical protein ENI06_10050, partial [Spirochaetales bacterium]|nr:hypothetical protein [Spirochaetales bacterium]